MELEYQPQTDLEVIVEFMSVLVGQLSSFECFSGLQVLCVYICMDREREREIVRDSLGNIEGQEFIL